MTPQLEESIQEKESKFLDFSLKKEKFWHYLVVEKMLPWIPKSAT